MATMPGPTLPHFALVIANVTPSKSPFKDSIWHLGREQKYFI